MDIKSFTQLEGFLLNKKQRFVDIFLFQLHLERIVDRRNSVGLHNDVQACIKALKGSYRTFENAENSINNHIKTCHQSLIPDEYLTWLDKKNLRLCNFVWLYLKGTGLFNEVTLDAVKANSNKHYIVIRALDMLPKKMPFKIELINNIHNAWLVGIDYPGWRYDWLDIRNELQCKKAFDFLTKKASKKSVAYSKPSPIDNTPELNDYFKFLASVDVWSTFSRDKQNFYKKISDAARKWKTPEQKKAQIKLKSKAKENNHILLKDKKSLKTLQIIQEKMGHKTPEETLKHIISEQAKQATFSDVDQTPAKVELQEDDEANLKQPQNGKDELFSKKLEEIASELDIPPPPRKS